MAADIMETFRTSAEKHTGDVTETMEGTVAKALREVIGTLKDNGVEVTLDVRPGALGCPRSVAMDDYTIFMNGTLMLDGLPIIVTAGHEKMKVPGGYDKRESYLRLHLGGSCVQEIELGYDREKPSGKWRAKYNSGDLKTEFTVALARVQAGSSYLNQFDLNPTAPTATTNRIEVSAPLKLKMPGQAA